MPIALRTPSAIALLLMALGAVPATAAQGRYDDPQGRFSVPVPAGWTAKAAGEDGVTLSRGAAYTSIVILPEVATAVQAFRQVGEQIAGQWRLRDQVATQITVNGQTAMLGTASGTNPQGVPSRLRILGLSDGRQGFALIGAAPEREYAAAEATLQAIEQGFAITTPAAGNAKPDVLPTTGAAAPGTGRPMLGVALTPLSDEEARSRGLPSTSGALVTEVVAGGASEQAGIQPGDVIIGVDGRMIGQPRDLLPILGAHQVGDVVNVMVLREGNPRPLKVKLGMGKQP